MRITRSLKKRIIFIPPQWKADDFRDVWSKSWRGHACDEYGNCSYYAISALLGGIEIFPFPHYQKDVKLPKPGENPWTDRVYWKDVIESGALTGEERARADQRNTVMPGSSGDRASAS